MHDSMKIYTLLKTLSPLQVKGPTDTEITGLHYDSRTVVPGGAFFALRGETADGHRFIEDAIARGAKAVFMEERIALPAGVTGVQVDNTRRTMAHAAAAFFNEPTADIPVVGVTGTNGKTTVTYLLESILRAAGKVPAVFGTINYRLGGHCLSALHTTPESVDLLRTLAEFRKQGADALVMEASSHALEQSRTDGVRFDVGVFTNLTPEHLDYHRDMDAYFASKSLLFDRLPGSRGEGAVINVDDPYGVQLAARFESPLTCGTASGARIRPREYQTSLDGIVGMVDSPMGSFSLNSKLVGKFNLQNLLCAAGAALALGIDPETVAEGLREAPPVPGRLERIDNRLGALILVDYAHTRDALEKVLETLTALAPRRIITVFGCGGDRDRTKRPAMGEVAARLSDLVVLTSDNPRTEDPQTILEEVRAGVVRVLPRECPREQLADPRATGYVAVTDRREAINLATDLVQPGDLLLVAGKGHEDYQIIGRERFHFDDREELRMALARREASL